MSNSAYAVVQHARSCLESLSPVALLSSALQTESSAVFAEALESGCSLEEAYRLAALIEIHATCSPGCYSSVLHAYGLSTAYKPMSTLSTLCVTRKYEHL